MKVRALIADDELLARERLRTLLSAQPEIELVGECSDGHEAATEIRDKKPDLIFLDIQMPELNGFAVLEAINLDPMPVIVFVTAHDQFALRAFEVQAVDYLLKPFDRERFQSALGRALEQVKHRQDRGTLSDALGRRRIIILGMTGYAGAAAICAGAQSFDMLLVGRFLQGLTAVAGMVVGRAIVRHVHAGDAAQRALALLTVIFGIAPGVAPIVGGWIGHLLGWRAVFARPPALSPVRSSVAQW